MFVGRFVVCEIGIPVWSVRASAWCPMFREVRQIRKKGSPPSDLDLRIHV